MLEEIKNEVLFQLQNQNFEVNNEAAIKSYMFSGLTRDEAIKKVEAATNRPKVREGINRMISNYSKIKRYKTHGGMGENPLTMRDIRFFEDENFEMTEIEIEALFVIDDTILNFE